MSFTFSEDDLILHLGDAEEQALSGRPVDSTFEDALAEFDTLVQQMRQPAPHDPFDSEPELNEALDRVQAIGQTPPTLVQSDSSNDSPSGSTVPNSLLGQYELLNQIGIGGMGTVYRARHTRLDRLVALKVLPPGRSQSNEAIARFNREMRAVGKLQHPHIVAAQDAGDAGGTHYLVMELVDGCDLGSLLKHSGQLSVADACEIARQAALGLQHLAEHGLVHRDLKPSNLMLARSPIRGQPPTVKILDLGLAQFISGEQESGAEITQTGQVLGTVGYMAPEQGFDGVSRFDIRTDLYSLGATLFKLLTSRAPFEDPKYNTTMKRLRALEEETPPTLAALRSDCPPELSALVARLLARSPADRPSKPEEVAQALLPFTHGADLAALLRHPAPSGPSIAGPLSQTSTQCVTESLPPESDRSSAQLAVAAGPPRKILSRPLGFTLLALLGLIGVLFAVVTVTTDQGTISIEAPDDLLEQIRVSFLREGTPADSAFVIEPGVHEHRIRAGRIHIQWPNEVEDRFEITPQEELLVRRGETITVRITRRPPDKKPAAPPVLAGQSRDRAAAEWVLSVGGQVTVDFQPGQLTVANAADLPEIPFEVYGVNLSVKSFQNQDLAKLAGLSSLVTFSAMDTGLDDTGLAALTDSGNNPPPKLEHLGLIRTKITDVGIGYLSPCTELKILHLFDTQFHDVRLLAPLSKLTSLGVLGCRLDKTSIPRLKELPCLGDLRINAADWALLLEEADFDPRQLVSIEIYDPEGEFDATQLQRLPQLQALNLATDPKVIQGRFWETLGKLPALRSLVLGAPFKSLAYDAQDLNAELPGLIDAEFSHSKISGDFLDRLFRQAPRLSILRFHWSDVSDDAYARLSAATNLEQLHFGGDAKYRDQVVPLADRLPKCDVTYNSERVRPAKPQPESP